MKIHYLLYSLSMAAMLLFSGSILGQQEVKNRFGFSAVYALGFQGKQVRLNQEVIENNRFNSARLNFNHTLYFLEKLSLQSSVGYQFGTFQGTVNAGRYYGTTHKVYLSEKIGFHFTNGFSALVGVSMTNNLDFEEFRSKSRDLFRFNLETEVAYSISKKWDVSLGYLVALTANEDVYLFTNPYQSLLIGMHYYLR